jgi:hypothetical protein
LIALAALAAVADRVKSNALRPLHDPALDRARQPAPATEVLRKLTATWPPVLRLVGKPQPAILAG